MGYLYLSISILAEVIATSALKASEQFTQLWPSVIVIVGYATAFFALSFVLKTIPVGVAYAIWSGAGVALITLAGLVLFDQRLDFAAVAGITLIVAGVLIINVFSKSAA